MKKYFLYLVLLLAVGCSSGKAQIEPKQVVSTLLIGDSTITGMPVDIAVILPPTKEERIIEPAGAFLSKIGDRANKIKASQKPWRAMGSVDKPIAIKTPAQIVTTTVKPLIIHKPVVTPPKPIIAPTGSKNIDNLITYVIGSISVILIGVVFARLKKKMTKK